MKAIRILQMVMLALVVVGASAAPAAAHAAYKDSDPPDKGQVSSPPSQVTATFTEPLANGSYLQITDPCGQRVDAGDVRIVGYDMSVSMSGAAAGLYTVYYKAFSTLDPHVTDGTFSFTATSGDPCAGAEEPEDEPAEDAPDQENESFEAAVGDDSDRSAGAGPSRASAPGNRGPKEGDGSRSRPGGAVDRARTGRTDDDLAGPEGTQLAAENEAPPSPSVWDGIRLEPFLTGLLLAAIVGAAGGKIYAGIMGPRA